MHWTMLMTSRKFILLASRGEKLQHLKITSKALVHSAADAYDKKSEVTTHATRNAYSQGLDIYDPVEYLMMDMILTPT